MIEFAFWVTVVSTAAAFVLSLMRKWGVLEWLQVHAPCEFLNKMFSCSFCMSFHVGMILAIAAAVATGNAWLLAVPVCSTTITRALW